MTRLKEALKNVPDEKPSYGPGIYGATDGPSSHMTTPFVRETEPSIFLPSTNQFVAMACGPEWYVAKVHQVDEQRKDGIGRIHVLI